MVSYNQKFIHCIIIQVSLLLHGPTPTTMASTITTISPHSIVPIILDKFHSYKGQGIICMFGAIRRSYWWLLLHQGVVKYINKCSICAKYLHNVAKYPPPKNLEVLHILMAVLAIDTTGHLSVMSKGNRCNLFSHIIYVCCANKGKIS